MKKSFLVFALAGLLSLPSVVLADEAEEEMMTEPEGAILYGSLRSGWKSNETAGVDDFASRFGIMGSSTLSEGLTAVYKFEHDIASDGDLGDSGRLSYVGLSGGFGTLAVGRVNSAAGHFSGVVDQSYFLGASEVPTKTSNTVSYSVSVGSISLQADIEANKGGGMSKATGMTENKDVDASQLGVTMSLGENAKVGMAHINRDAMKGKDDKQTVIAGQYTVGGMTLHLGFGQRTKDIDGAAADAVADRKDKTTYFGARGGLGDTGVSYVMQVRSKKGSGKLGDGTAINDTNVGMDGDHVSKHTPWMFGLYRSLGGGATIAIEHSNPDMDKEKSTTALALIVNF